MISEAQAAFGFWALCFFVACVIAYLILALMFAPTIEDDDNGRSGE
jgi:hypothetical protein